MSSSRSHRPVTRFTRRSLLVGCLLGLSGCQFQPVYGDYSAQPGNLAGLTGVTVSQVDSRVGQQVRNHLLFLMHGGRTTAAKTHEARLRVTWSNREQASIQGTRDNVSGTITVVAIYDLVDLSTGKAIASGSRQAQAYYDRTGQVFANTRAERDAQNRAAREAAESLRIAIASDLSRT